MLLILQSTNEQNVNNIVNNNCLNVARLITISTSSLLHVNKTQNQYSQFHNICFNEFENASASLLILDARKQLESRLLCAKAMSRDDAYINFSKTRNYLEKIDAIAIVLAQVKEVIKHYTLLFERKAPNLLLCVVQDSPLTRLIPRLLVPSTVRLLLHPHFQKSLLATDSKLCQRSD